MNFDQTLEEGEIDEQVIIKDDYMHKNQQVPQITFEQVMDSSIFNSLQLNNPDGCVMCKIDKAKYKCPGCNRRSCSLKCCKKHKIAFRCSGNRNSNGMIAINDYKERDATRDYKFLSDVILGTEVIEKRLVGTNALPDALRYKLLKQQARKQYEVDVRLAPKLLQRHRDNISFYSCADKMIYWCIELRIYLGPGVQQNSYQIDPISQNSTLRECLKQTNLFSTEILTQHQLNLETDQLISLISKEEMLIYYPFEKVQQFLEQEEYKFNNQKKNNHRKGFNQPPQHNQIRGITEFIRIDLKSKLFEVIKNSTVYEFPVFILVPNKYHSSFNRSTKKDN